MKRAICFRLYSWVIGIMLMLISRYMFFNGRNVIVEITMVYNELVVLSSMIPIALILILMNMLREKKIGKHLLKMFFVLGCFFIYVCFWVGCTGGV